MQFAIQYCGVAPLQRSLSSVAEPGQQFVWLLPLSVAEPEPPLLGWSRSRFFIWPEPRFGAAFFKAAPAATFWQAKKESLVLLLTKQDLKALYYDKCDPKRLALIIPFLRTQNEK